MKPSSITKIAQTLFGGCDAPPELIGNCFPACMASLLGLQSIDEVPHFYQQPDARDNPETWWRMVEWLQARGLSMLCFEWPLPEHMHRSLLDAAVIVSGKSPRYDVGLHAVIGKITADSWELLHDPFPARL